MNPSNSLATFASGGARFPSKLERAENAQRAAIVSEARIAGLWADAGAAVAARGMERIVDLDGLRKALAGNDEVLDAILQQVEINYAQSVLSIQRHLGSAFPR
ncbi:hypothetical protein [Nocardioides sp. KR10-350]|jgi:hypothetical protein|uniref:hypothetical protein n=1 Tax=Nocardioides cheoyonin TaxID=3156615 RepID=UPI0032B58843